MYITGKWVVILNESELERAIPLARGSYQSALLFGHEALSGSTLRGRAKKYGYHYAKSRDRFLDRLSSAGIYWTEERGPHGRRLLVIGKPDPLDEVRKYFE